MEKILNVEKEMMVKWIVPRLWDPVVPLLKKRFQPQSQA